MRDLGWGIVGTGGHADTYMAPAINSPGGGARLVAVVSRDSDRARDFGSRHNARGLTRYEELLADPQIDVVLITTPNAQHPDQVVAAAEAGKHVLCDKPLALDEPGARRAVEACERAGVKLGINFQTRYTSAARHCRQVIESGAIGDTLIVNAEHGSGRGQLQGWRTDPNLAGRGAVFNLGVHSYDLVRYLVGVEVDEAFALFDTGATGELERQALTLLRFANGTMAYVNVNHTVGHVQNDLTVYGTKGRVVGRNMTRHMQEGELCVVTDGEHRESMAFDTRDAYQRVINDMVAAIVEDRSPHASGLDGLRSVQLTDAIARSATERRAVKVGR